MFFTVFKETAKKIVRNKKNRLIVILCLLAVFLYALFYLPSYNHPASIDTEQLILETESEYGMKESRLSQGDIAINSFTGVDTYSLAKWNYEALFEYRDAVDKGDFNRLMEVTAAWGLPEFAAGELNDYLDETIGGDIPSKDYMRNIYTQHIEEVAALEVPTPHIFNERTGIQQVYKFFLNYGPLIILFVTIFVVSDVLVSDRHHRTIKAGQPIGWRRYVFYQSLSAYIILLVGISALLAVFFMVTGLLYGFGDGSMSVPRYSYEEGYRGEAFNFTIVPVVDFIVQSLVFSAVLIYFFIRVNAFLSLIFRHDVVVMIISFLMIAFNRIYSGGAENIILGIPSHYFPQNYFEFGDVLGGRLNFLNLSDAFTFMQGMIVTFAAIVVLEIILWAVQSTVTRQKFERGSA
ncbi:hypothetical protein [Corticicoccus populi]|uniref:ABC transporter permease n=1 Tax=Corticicoccus populi TaxID=1812821 RepID=A0ABW5WXC3_9STAP